MLQSENQINFILAPQQLKSSINKANTNTFPVADIGFGDHDLPPKIKKKGINKNHRIMFELRNLNIQI
ncbi:hypothetical protein DPMN_044832 [Dreissena polymorpha]|uniref:Uncharacterized protein n=1 Tax=Dreissena polymorpha TaxID=45954 RepID=A0A9D4HZ33_DREPO|nr:hypothetical protein DPMN_044832 [Dreissena polymorpha]